MIIRATKKESYTCISNKVFQSGLSLKATGLICWLLSKPDNWNISISGCESQLQESKNTINKYLLELEDAGYASKKRTSTGKVDWIISDEPHPNNWDKEKPHPKKPHPNNCVQVITDIKVNTEETIGARRISPDWTPDLTSKQWIESHGVTLEQAKPAILGFIDYWSQRQTRRKSWDRSFRQNGVVQSQLLRIKTNNEKSNRPYSGNTIAGTTAQRNADAFAHIQQRARASARTMDY